MSRTPAPRLVVDGACLANRRGFGRFARRVLDALALLARRDPPNAPEILVLVDEPSAARVRVPEPLRPHVVPLREAPAAAARSDGRRALGDILGMARAAARLRPDVLLFPASYTYVPAWNARKVVVAVHDTLPLDYPEWVFPTRRGYWFYAAKEKLAVAASDRLITVSRASKRDLLRKHRLDPHRVSVVPEGADATFRPDPPGDLAKILDRFALPMPADNPRYLLYVGGLSPHKNLPRAIRAFARAAADRPDLRFVLVGDHADVFHTHLPELRAAARDAGVADRVHFPGFVPDPELAALYSRALALVQPSLLEGFGLPPVEALACGTPVLAANAGSLPEVLGDAGHYFDPADERDIARALRQALPELENPERRADLRARALDRAARYTLEATADALAEALEPLFGGIRNTGSSGNSRSESAAARDRRPDAPSPSNRDGDRAA